jgi:pimeloyl-ACP methyl ester carboxylesterase
MWQAAVCPKKRGRRHMTTFVLVHGSYNGAHGFRFVRPILHAAGHEVFTPSLTGVGERVHLAHSGINLSTHIRDVVNTILYEDLTDIVLLGLSYGGAVVTGAVEHVADRIHHLVYVDALVPNDGESVLSLSGIDRPSRIALGENWLVPPLTRDFDDPEVEAFITARSSHQPVETYLEPCRVTVPLESRPFGLTYIRATTDPAEAPGNSAFRAAAERARQSPRWRYIELDTGHMIPMNRPDELAQILLDLN